MLKRVMSRFFKEFFFLAVPKNFAGEPFCAVFQKVSGSENVYGRERGKSKISVETFLSYSAKNFRWGTL